MPRTARRHAPTQMLEKELDEQPEAIDAVTSDDGDHISEQSTGEDYDSGDNSSEDAAAEMDVDEDDLENVSLHQRLLDAQSGNGMDKPECVSSTKKNGTTRMKFTERPSGRPSAPQKINIRSPAGPSGPAANIDKLEQFWQALMPDEIFEKIVIHTNNQIEHVCATMMAQDQLMQTHHHLTDIDEIKALVGLFYYAGSRRDSNVSTHNMWDKKHGITLYRCAMPRARYSFLCSCLRFDDKQTRDKTDKFAPIRQIWSTFIKNCTKCYNMGGKTVVDEQLLGFRGHCPFRVCITSKLGNKYGIKLITLNDADTGYLANAIPYLGKDCIVDRISGEKNSEFFFRKVTEPIHGSGRTVTCDSWFTSIPLIERFLEKPYNVTITGTIRKNKAEIPSKMKLASKTIPCTSFCATKNITLASHTPKRNKILLVASSYLKSTEVINGKPKILSHYEETKTGADYFNRLCQAYSTAMRTTRWPMRFFLGILDQAAVNACILFKCSKRNANKNDAVIKAYDCLQDLALHLLRPYMRSRIDIPTLRTDLRLGIQAILNVHEVNVREEERPRLDEKSRCEMCPRKSDQKTRKQCPSCLRAMCDEHRVYLCVECAKTE